MDEGASVQAVFRKIGQDDYHGVILPNFPSFQNFPTTPSFLSPSSLVTHPFEHDEPLINRTKPRNESSVGRLSPIIIHAAFSLRGTRGGLSNDLTDTLYHTYTPHFLEQTPRPSDPFPQPVFIFLRFFRVNERYGRYQTASPRSDDNKHDPRCESFCRATSNLFTGRTDTKR